jgi:hypothetical protein
MIRPSRHVARGLHDWVVNPPCPSPVLFSEVARILQKMYHLPPSSRGNIALVLRISLCSLWGPLPRRRLGSLLLCTKQNEVTLTVFLRLGPFLLLP